MVENQGGDIIGDIWGDIGSILNAPFRAASTALDNAAAVTGYVATFIRYMIYIIIIIVVIIIAFYIIRGLIDVKYRLSSTEYQLKAKVAEKGILQEVAIEPGEASVESGAEATKTLLAVGGEDASKIVPMVV